MVPTGQGLRFEPIKYETLFNVDMMMGQRLKRWAPSQTVGHHLVNNCSMSRVCWERALKFPYYMEIHGLSHSQV